VLPFCWILTTNAFGQRNDMLTDTEWVFLQNRIQLHRTDVFSNINPEQRKLLKSPSREISPITGHLDELITQMIQAMQAHDGKGLTAVQIGIPVRVVIMERILTKAKVNQIFINPKLISKSDQITQYWERCLSLPEDRDHLTTRHDEVTIRYKDHDGNPKIEKFNGIESAVFQQELDHLDGILLSDHDH